MITQEEGTWIPDPTWGHTHGLQLVYYEDISLDNAPPHRNFIEYRQTRDNHRCRKIGVTTHHNRLVISEIDFNRSK